MYVCAAVGLFQIKTCPHSTVVWGFTEDQAARLAQEDERKQARKAEIEARLQGESQSKAVSQLRETIFGADAVTIAREEKAGFYRFERPRLYGRN